MGGEKHGSKSGRYVGSFMQLFDWNAKSRKKLFSSKSDIPVFGEEQTKHGRKHEGNVPSTRHRLVEDEGYSAGFSFKVGSDYSCASSVTDDDLYGAKAPSVVARLMGLDSLPTSNGLEPYSTPYFDTHSVQDVPFRGRNFDYYHEHQIMPSRHLLDKMESPPRNAMDIRPRRMPNRPIEKFQSEVLPPRSAKTIPIPHHKLLSPIKSPIFIPSQDAAHIMEAAARIIGPGPQATPRTRLSSSMSSSVPFKVRELREKLEAAQRPSKTAELSQRAVESSAAKSLKGQPMNRSWNGSVDSSSSFKVSPSRDDSSVVAKSKGKSVSLAVQAKVNVQKREGLASSSRSLVDQDDTKSTHSSKSQSNGHKMATRKSSSQSNSSVLRQNNQKQNCSTTFRDKPASKSAVTLTSSGKKAVSEENTSQQRQKSSVRDAGPLRTGSRKSSLQARNGDREAQGSGVRNVPRKKRSLDNDLYFSKNQVTDDLVGQKHEKQSHDNVADRHLTWIEESRKKGMDVVSFTFTAPITRSLPGSEGSRQLGEKSSNVFMDERNKRLLSSDFSRMSSSGVNVIGGDALSVLLEQKLKELTSNLEGSRHNFNKTDMTEDSSQETFGPGSAESATWKSREKKAKQEPQVNDTNKQIFSASSSAEPEQLRRKHKVKALELMGEYGTKVESRLWSDYRAPSPVSILEPPTLTESCHSSESMTSSITEESKQCSSSVQAQAVVGLSSSEKIHRIEAEADISDSASSSQINAARNSMKSTASELGYIKDVLCNVELMFKDYATGRTREIINPHLFDQMERRKGSSKVGKDESLAERKLLFDCTSECLDLKCQHFVGGGFEMWTKGVATVKRKDRLAEEVLKEIDGWRSLGNCMVDELVDKDMSSKYGRWLDFQADEFMLGVEIEGQILDSLVAEIVTDILPSDLSYK